MLYVGVTLVLAGIVEYTDLRRGSALVGDGSATLATTFEAHGIGWAQMVINVGGLAGLTMVVMVMLGRTRVLFAMSRDGLVTRKLARTNHKGVPVRITLIVGGVVAVLVPVFPMGVLEEMVNIGRLFAFVLVCVGVMVLRRPVPSRPTAWIPGAAHAVGSDPRCDRVWPADAEPVCGDVDPVRGVDGAGCGCLLRLRSVLGQRLAAEPAEQAAAQGEIRESEYG